MKTNFKITIEYDGTPFSGWQVQNNSKTVQGELEKALSMILNQPIRINGSGRTDAGVHALGQVATFHAMTILGCEELKKGVNSLIKCPIIIHECVKVHDKFHARYDARQKEYHYHILNRQDPSAIGKDYIWHIQKPLDLATMEECCSIITGTHDFKAFEGSGSPRSTTIRTIFSAKFEIKEDHHLVFKIRGNGFLRFMVRNIMGTLVLAGIGKLTPKEFRTVLEKMDRNLAGATAPARGLFLMNVIYDSEQLL